MTGMDDWTTQVCDALGLDADPQVAMVLRVAKDVSHGVLRPAAPVTAYLLGIAVGRGADPDQVERVIADLVARHPRPS